MTEGPPKTRQQSLEEHIASVQEWTDRLGSEMDPGIVETVACLNLLGIPTVGSCDGHLDHGSANPWVNVTAPDEPDIMFEGEQDVKRRIAAQYGIAPDDIDRNEHKDADTEYYDWMRAEDPPLTKEYHAWREREGEVGHKLTALINEFNANRSDAEPIYFHTMGVIAGRPEPVRESKDIPGLDARLQERRKTMRAFTEFLRDRYLRS